MLHTQSQSNSDEEHRIYTFFSKHIPFHEAPGNIIIHPDERPSFIYYLDEGIVEQTKTTLKGQELTMNLYKPGSFFTLMDSVADIPNQYTFIALDYCSGFKAPVEEVITWMKADRDVSFEIASRLLKGLHGMLLKTEKLMQRDATSIVAQTLLTFMARFPMEDTKNLTISITFTHQQLADSTGLSRETITRELSEMKNNGIISVEHKQIVIYSLPALQKLAESVREITVL